MMFSEKMVHSTTGYVLGWGAAFLISAPALGFGLGVTGIPADPNFYYAVEDGGVEKGELYRYHCPKGVVPTRETCPDKDPTFMISYSVLRTALSHDLKDRLEVNDRNIKKEVSALKEKDPQVESLRTTIRDELKKVADLEKKQVELTAKSAQLTANLGTVKQQLKLIVAKLTTDLPQEELLRTVEVHTERTKQKNQFESERTATEVLITELTTEVETSNQVVTTASVQLGRLLPTLVVQSPLLIELQETKVQLEAQLGLIPELDKRLTDPVAYPLNAWIESGIPGVEALVNQFLAFSCRMAKGEIVSRGRN